MKTIREGPRPCGCGNSSASASLVGPVPPHELEGLKLLSLPKLSCDGVEITQSIQNMAHGVPLVAGKRTVVRVY